MIYFNNDSLKQSVCIDAGDLSYIVITVPQYGWKQGFSLSHEMGHAICNHILKDVPHYDGISICGEITSTLTERLFFNYLLESGKADYDFIKKIRENELYSNLYTTNNTKKVLDLLDDSKVKYSFTKNDAFTIKYQIDSEEKSYDLTETNYIFGNIISAHLYLQYLSDKEYFIKHFRDIVMSIMIMSFEEVLNNYSDLSSYKKYLEKTLIKK